jgi:hypothetical protein
VVSVVQRQRPFLQTTVKGSPQWAGGQETPAGTSQGVPSFGTTAGHGGARAGGATQNHTGVPTGWFIGQACGFGAPKLGPRQGVQLHRVAPPYTQVSVVLGQVAGNVAGAAAGQPGSRPPQYVGGEMAVQLRVVVQTAWVRHSGSG